jgi:hypothetical protein
MPFYEFDVTSPANTAQASPTQVLAVLTPGVVTQVAIQIPLGVKALTGAQVWRGDHQVWPANPEGFFKGDDTIIAWDDTYDLEDEPLTLRLRVWNNDDSYPHTITFRFAVLPLALKEAAGRSRGLLERIAKTLFGES